MEGLMRLQSKVHVTIRNKIIGGPNLLICLPLVAEEKSDLLKQAQELKQLDPDLFEWRIDGYGNVKDVDESLQALGELRTKIGDIPLIFSCRIISEGGLKEITQNLRLKLIKAAIQSGDLDIVDIEMCNESNFIEEVLKTARDCDARLILSYHNFENTPDEALIYDKLVQAQDLGADIAKVAVMPKGYKDVLKLLGATLKAREEALKIPIVAMAMGPEGGVTRLVGGLFGSDITFAIGKTASAPGQIPIETLRKAMAALYE
jgi:3-dehydroquinate dehydratase-1